MSTQPPSGADRSFNRSMLFKLVAVACLMFGFGFALVPMYRAICEVTGINNLVQRDATGQHAKVTGKTVGLRLQPATYQHAINEGLTFDERIDSTPVTGSLRVVVVDVNSGHMGSVTVPTAALEAMR